MLYRVYVGVNSTHLSLMWLIANHNRQRHSNKTLVESKVKRIHEFVDTRNRDLGFLEQQLSKEQLRLGISEKAITNLTVTINRAEKVLKSHESILQSLLGVQEQFLRVEWNEVLDMEDEGETNKSCGQLTSFIVKTFERGSTLAISEV
jgi:hypothetical protein